MSLEFGFYDSYNGDRKYTAQNMNDIFEGLITDGVYMGVGDEFEVKPGNGLQITVGTGRAWFKMTWNKNQVVTPIDIDKSDPVYTRIDTVCIRVNKGVNERENEFYIYKGTIQTNPEPPIIIDGDNVYYLPIANVTIRPNADQIKASDIEILVGKERCPYVTSILQQTSIDKLFQGWEEQFLEWIAKLEEELEHLDVGEVLIKLQNMVDKRDKATDDDVTPEPGKEYSDDKWMTPKKTESMIEAIAGDMKGGVTSFNGRTGDIEPEAGDYSAEDVGALPIEGGTVSGDLNVFGNFNVGLSDDDKIQIALKTIKANDINFKISESGEVDRPYGNFKINDVSPFVFDIKKVGTMKAHYNGATSNKKIYTDVVLGSASETFSVGNHNWICFRTNSAAAVFPITFFYHDVNSYRVMLDFDTFIRTDSETITTRRITVGRNLGSSKAGKLPNYMATDMAVWYSGVSPSSNVILLPENIEVDVYIF